MNFTFTLTEQEANILLNALAQRPYMEVVEVVHKIRNQASEQINKKEEIKEEITKKSKQ